PSGRRGPPIATIRRVNLKRFLKEKGGPPFDPAPGSRLISPRCLSLPLRGADSQSAVSALMPPLFFVPASGDAARGSARATLFRRLSVATNPTGFQPNAA
ncbi:MAG TPA: hypothetical protein VIJ38_02325, partial [Acidobacteriaceae bacterium]